MAWFKFCKAEKTCYAKHGGTIIHMPPHIQTEWARFVFKLMFLTDFKDKILTIQTKHFMLAELMAMHLQVKRGSYMIFLSTIFFSKTKPLIKKM